MISHSTCMYIEIHKCRFSQTHLENVSSPIKSIPQDGAGEFQVLCVSRWKLLNQLGVV